ncbi:hypothetical protein K440DRAFT_287804 [Wilcoxina mikolae CBS 423.85]|nr:hypothetical protein K440DRAFT_287804 [Wilcoxina mikolae CBS 423.85]
MNLPDWVTSKELLWNATPKYRFTDLHIDQGMDTFTFQAGGKKLWLLWELEKDTDHAELDFSEAGLNRHIPKPHRCVALGFAEDSESESVTTAISAHNGLCF